VGDTGGELAVGDGDGGGVSVGVAVAVGVEVAVAVAVGVGLGVPAGPRVQPPVAGPPEPLQKYSAKQLSLLCTPAVALELPLAEVP